MCQAKPGPRCASHLTEQIDRTKRQLAENEHAFVSGGHPSIPHPGVSRGTLAMLEDEFDETPTGQRKITARIRGLREDTPAARFQRAELTRRKTLAAARYAAKKAALKATQNGNERRARIHLRYGADAGWLEHSALAPLSAKATTTMTVLAVTAEACGYTWVESSTDYDYAGQPTQVTDYGLTYETPLTPGPRPGTWLTGTPTSHRRTDPLLVTDATIDQPAVTLTSHDPAHPDRAGAPVTAEDLDAGATISDHTGHRTSDQWDETWDEPEIIRDATGTPVLLRITGKATAYQAAPGRSRQIA